MPIPRRAALALLPLLLGAAPAFAATCNLTVLGTSRLDDAECTIATGRGLTRVTVGTGGPVGTGGTVLIRRSTLLTRLPGDPVRAGRRRAGYVSYGQVIRSGDSDDKTCYFNQRAVLCVER